MASSRTRNLTILLTDIKDFTAATATRSRAEIALMLDRHRELVLPVLERHGGKLIKSIGDAFLVTFESPTDAVLGGVAVQDAIERYNSGTPANERFEIRIAVNQGEVNIIDNDVYGDPVNIAARVEELAQAGEVYFTDAVYLSMNKREVRSTEVGVFELKGVAETVRVYKVRRELSVPNYDPPVAHRPTAPIPRTPQPSPASNAEVNLKLDLPAAPPPGVKPAQAPAPAFVPAAPVAASGEQWGGPTTMQKPEELIGKDVGPVRIEKIMGRGGMGVVFKGQHKRLDRPVAVKVIIPSIHRSAAASELLLKEARLVARMEDPRVVQVYDVGTQGSLSFIVMQFIEGETLADRVIRRGKLSAVEAVNVMKEVLLGLAAAHAKGIVHRDLKPSNIMIDRSGAVKLLDFGIAGVTGNEEFAPDATFSGTLDFMAPEQAFGAKADPRMDLYSFGATYYFALTGSPPFAGANDVEVMMKHREAPIPDVRTLNREAPPAAAALISRLMQKFPEGRPASTADVLAELGKPAMTMNVDASGSPFKILPAPVEQKVGLAAEMEAMGRPTAEISAATRPAGAAPGAAAVMPPPPPPVDFSPGRIPAVTWAIFAALFFVFFGTSWSSLTHADWLAAGAVSVGGAAALAYLGAEGWLERLAGPALLGASCWFFFVYGASPGEAFPPPAPPFEIIVLLLLGLILALSGIYLGYLSSPAERDLSAILLLGGGVFLLVSGTARGLPESAGLVSGLVDRLGADLSALGMAGGLSRWAGPVVLYGAYRFARYFRYDPAQWSRTKTGDGRIINWNK